MTAALKNNGQRPGIYSQTKKVLKGCTSLNSTGGLMLGLLALAPAAAVANPQGGNVVDGSATIQNTPDELQIHQSSDRAIIEWSSFDIDAGETTRFYQPNASSVALNRVINSSQLSRINGNLIANGNVMVINPNGVIIGDQGNVDTNSFIATSADIDNNHFMTTTGPFDFNKSGNMDAVVENYGNISVADAGIAGLVAPTVRNSGVIQGRVSKVQLAAADKFGVDLYGDGLISFAVDAPASGKRKLLAENSGSIITDGGSVLMTAAAASDVVESAINNTGTIKATSLVKRGGKIILTGKGAEVNVSGVLDVSGETGGGEINVGGKPTPLDKPGPITGLNTYYAGPDESTYDRPEYQMASRTKIFSDAVLSADSTGNGSGGHIFVWSREATWANGLFTARGGPSGGAGGFIETSAIKWLDVTGAKVDTRDAYGGYGTWLIDPDDVIFKNTPPFGTFGAISLVDVATINSALSHVIIEALKSISFQNGSVNIDIAAPNVNLTLLAGQAPSNPGETITGQYYDASGNLVSKSFDSSDSTINMIGGSYIRTNGGNVSMFGANAVKMNAGWIYTNGGDILVTAGGIPIDNNTLFATGGGDVILKAVKTDVTAGDVKTNNMRINTTGGTGPGGITMIVDGVTVVGTLNDLETTYGIGNTFEESANAGTVTIDADAVFADNNNNCFSAGGSSCIIDDPNPPLATDLTYTADDKLITYGQPDPVFTGSITFGALVAGDAITGAMTRDPGTNVGTYSITQGTLAPTGGNGTYNFTFIPGTLTISPYLLSVIADAKSKTYGDADPALTYTFGTLQNGDTASVFSGALSRAAGENVGAYGINQGTLSAGSNYTISYTGANLTINPAILNIAADAKSKVYGDADPALTFGATGFKNGDTAAIITGALSRVAGENVGSYQINQGSVSAGSNYTVNYTPANLTITKAVLNLLLNGSASKVYGDADPAALLPFFSVTGFKNGDTDSILSGDLARAAGENVGNYPINVGTLSAGGNYSLNLNPANFGITPAVLNIAADAKSKTYGDADPALTFGATGFKNGDTSSVISGALSRVAGENVGAYQINQGSVSAGSNYTINYTPANLTITQAVLNLLLNGSAGKVYGDVDPALLPFFSVTGFKNGDTDSILSGDLARAAGENVGDYPINLGTLSAGGNYSLNLNPANFGITPAVLNIVADAKNKVFGDADPALTYGASGFKNGDTVSVVSGDLSRDPGEDVGTYGINQGTVSAGSNYTINYTPANFTISNLLLSIIADNKTITYGDPDPALTFTHSGLQPGDSFTGSLVRDPGSNVGTYAINQGTLTAGGNYTISFTPGIFTIDPALLSIVADAKSKIYGDADPALTFAASGFKNGDTDSVISGALSRDAGENVGAYNINQGSLSAGGNYTVSYTPALLTIDPALLTIAADPQSKVYGSPDPTLTYVANGFKNGDTDSVISGVLSRNPGENVGTYGINQGSLSAGSNYTISYTSNDLTITPFLLSISADPNSKIYGDSDPTLTFTSGALQNGDTNSIFSGALARAAGENVGDYAINQGTLSAGSNYTISFAPANFVISPATLFVSADPQSKIYGDADPALTFASSGLVNGDTNSVFSGGLSRDSGENVGFYFINQGSLSAGGNYTIAYKGNSFIIDPRVLNVFADDKSKTYGSSDPTLTFSHDPLVNGDTVADVFEGSLTRDPGENVGGYDINQGSLAIIDNSSSPTLFSTSQVRSISQGGPNYIMNFTPGTLTINPALLSIIADAQSKDAGDPDPTLTFNASGFQFGDDVSILSGGLVRDPGEDAGNYGINQGSLAATPNYTVSYIGNLLTIIAPAPNAELPLTGIDPLARPIVSVANQAIEQDLPFESFDTTALNTDVSISGGTGGPGSLPDLAPAAGGNASDLAGLSPEAGPGSGAGTGAGTGAGEQEVDGNVACMNNFLSNKPCEVVAGTDI